MGMEMSPGIKVTKSSSVIEKLKEAWHRAQEERIAEALPRVEAKYGKLVRRAEALEIEALEQQVARCESCRAMKSEECLFYYEDEKYKRPRFEVVGGELKAERRLCTLWHERRYLQAGLPRRNVGKTLADYEVTAMNKRAVQIGRWYMDVKPAQNLYYYGGTGTGKTLLSSIIGGELAKTMRVRFWDVAELMEDIKRQFNAGDSVQEYITRLNKYEVLILDDFGTGQITEWNIGIMYLIVNGRYNEGKRLIVNSNYDLKGLEQKLGTRDGMTAKRIVSRLSENVVVGFFGVQDRRPVYGK